MAKRSTAPRTAVTAAKPTRTPWRPPITVIVAVLVLAAVAVGVVLSRRDEGDARQTASSGDFGHVHGLAVEPGGGRLYVATHAGLYRIDGERTAVRVSKQAIDLMGFTVAGSNQFLASGHPDPDSGGPANVGLIESTDGGVTWKTISLSGQADFHGLQAAHGAVYGINSANGAFMVSTDRKSWERRSTGAVGAFTVSPTDAQTVLGAGRAGLQRSTDGARTWQPISGAPRLGVLAWPQGSEVWGVDGAGGAWHSADAGATWQRRGTVPGEVEALTVAGTTLYAAVTGDKLVTSADGGSTWTTHYAAA